MSLVFTTFEHLHIMLKSIISSLVTVQNVWDEFYVNDKIRPTIPHQIFEWVLLSLTIYVDFVYSSYES